MSTVLLAFLCNVTEYGQSPIKEYNGARSSINNCSAKLLLKLMGTPCALECKNNPLFSHAILVSSFFLTNVSTSITPNECCGNAIPPRPEVSGIKVVPQSKIHTVAAQSLFFKMEPGTCSTALVRPCFSIFQD